MDYNPGFVSLEDEAAAAEALETATKFNKKQIVKELYLLKTIARLIFYANGKLYYNINLICLGAVYQFPISVIEIDQTLVEILHQDPTHPYATLQTANYLKFASDVGSTSLYFEMPARHLWRWIEKAILSGELIQSGVLKFTKPNDNS